jgi:hypothetical protein
VEETQASLDGGTDMGGSQDQPMHLKKIKA